MSEHSIEHHRTWAAFFTVAAVLVVAVIYLATILTMRSDRDAKRYAHEETVVCIQSDRPAADCRLIVYGSK